MSTPTIAFLGTGRMGLPMAMNLARAGFPLQVWNRTADVGAAQEGDLVLTEALLPRWPGSWPGHCSAAR